MPDANVETARGAYESFARGVELYRAGRVQEWERMAEWDELYEPDVVLEELSEFPDADTYTGVEGIKRWFRAGLETFEDVRWEPRDFTARGPCVLADVRGHFRGGISGADVNIDVTHVFTFRANGRIVGLRGFLDRDAALAFVESAESEGSP